LLAAPVGVLIWPRISSKVQSVGEMSRLRLSNRIYHQAVYLSKKSTDRSFQINTAILIVFDLGDRSQFEDIQKWLLKLQLMLTIKELRLWEKLYLIGNLKC
jgi:hypothetical protein